MVAALEALAKNLSPRDKKISAAFLKEPILRTMASRPDIARIYFRLNRNGEWVMRLAARGVTHHSPSIYRAFLRMIPALQREFPQHRLVSVDYSRENRYQEPQCLVGYRDNEDNGVFTSTLPTYAGVFRRQRKT